MSHTPGIPIFNYRNDYATNNVTSAAWFQVSATLGSDLNFLEVFDSSGEDLLFGIGPSGGEITVFRIVPGGNTPLPVAIHLDKGMRLVVKSVSAATISSGVLIINGYK